VNQLWRVQAYLDGNISQGNSWTAINLHARPMSVDIQGVGVTISDKVLHEDVRQRSTSAVGLDHHHLIGRDGIYVTVVYVRNVDVDAERPKCRATTPVTIYVFDEDVMCWALN
jgi:hypothetical protein